MDAGDVVERADLSSAPTGGLRPLEARDFPELVEWLNTPHVYRWWGVSSGPGSLGGPDTDAATLAQVAEKYRASVDGKDTTHRYVILSDRHPVGMIQWYRLADEPGYALAIGESPNGTAGIDLLVGVPGAIGRGIGPRAISTLVDGVVFAEADLHRVIGGPHPDNRASVRAFEKACFAFARDAMVPDEGPERVMARDRGDSTRR